MERRLGFVGIIIEDRRQAASKVNEILSRHGEHILARTGLPFAQASGGVIALIVQATTDELGDLTGRLGQVPGVTVKSALSRKTAIGGAEEVR